ncbi:MAG: hypothetical protein M3O50_07550 [Myxococcota bacterium]|nr:hypothetical protein [Myxococcota bacterium]
MAGSTTTALAGGVPGVFPASNGPASELGNAPPESGAPASAPAPLEVPDDELPDDEVPDDDASVEGPPDDEPPPDDIPLEEPPPEPLDPDEDPVDDDPEADPDDDAGPPSEAFSDELVPHAANTEIEAKAQRK